MITGLNYRASPLFVDILRPMRCSLLVSTGGSNRLIAIGVDGEQLVLSTHTTQWPTGIAANGESIAVAGGAQVSLLANNSVIAPLLNPRAASTRSTCPVRRF